MSTTSSRALELTVISGEDLKKVKKKNTFVTVHTNLRCYRTSISDGGSWPTWKEKLAIDLPAGEQYLTVIVQCKTPVGDKFIGTARVPVSDFTGGFFPENYLHFLSYRLRDVNGEASGIINLSLRGKVSQNKAAAYGVGGASYPQRWDGGPAADGRVSVAGIVTGIPVYDPNHCR